MAAGGADSGGDDGINLGVCAEAASGNTTASVRTIVRPFIGVIFLAHFLAHNGSMRGRIPVIAADTLQVMETTSEFVQFEKPAAAKAGVTGGSPSPKTNRWYYRRPHR